MDLNGLIESQMSWIKSHYWYVNQVDEREEKKTSTRYFISHWKLIIHFVQSTS